MSEFRARLGSHKSLWAFSTRFDHAETKIQAAAVILRNSRGCFKLSEKKNHIKVRVTNSSEPPYGIRQWSGESGGEAGVIVAVPVVMDPVLMDSRATPAMAVHRVRLD